MSSTDQNNHVSEQGRAGPSSRRSNQSKVPQKFGGGGRGGSRGKKRDMGRSKWSETKGDRRQRNEDEQATKRQRLENGEDEKLPIYATKFSEDVLKAEERRPKKKVAVLIGYSGTGYRGMQLTHDQRTIEGDLFQAFVAAGAISKANADDPKKSSFVRCARTDKGVHAAGNVISLKLIIEDSDIVEKINTNLSPQIRVWGYERTNNSFSAYQLCDSRIYEYLIPTHSFLPPHPSSYLGRKIDEIATQKGDEDGLRRRQEEVLGFWKRVEEEQIKPILDTFDEETRAILEKALYLRGDDNDDVAHGQDEPSRLAQPDLPASSPIDAKMEFGSKSEFQTVANTEVNPNTSTETNIDKSKEVKSEVVDDGSKAETQPVRDQMADAEDSRKPTPISEGIKELRNTYIAAKRAYRIPTSRLERVREALSLYEGTRNYHNFTVQKSFSDPSAKRVIKSFVVNPDPILINGTEWLSLKVHGQSFMMHQIRKMVSMVALTVRCGCDPKRIVESYGPEKISIPKAPSLGLLLERPVFDSYNRRGKHDLGRDPIDFDKFRKEMDEFKQREIYERMYRDEEKDNVFGNFFNHVDNFPDEAFLFVTSGGIEATQVKRESKDGSTVKGGLIAIDESDSEDAWVDLGNAEGVALQHHYGGQAPWFPSPISPASPLSTTGSSFSSYPVAASVTNPLPENIASTSLAASAPADPNGSLFVLVTQTGGAAPSSRRQGESPRSTFSTALLSSAATNVSSGVEQMKDVTTKATIGLLTTLIGYVSLNSLFKALRPEAFIWCDEDREEANWIATSKFWLDRKACRWIGVCGAAHFRFVRPLFGTSEDDNTELVLEGSTMDQDWQNAWSEGKDRPQDWTKDERVLREIPEYVMEYAPLVRLFSGEQFWPSDITEHLHHITPTLNYTPLPLQWQNPTIYNLNGLNEFEQGRHVFLTSDDDVEEVPGWLKSEKNIPNPPPDGELWEDRLGPHSDGRTYSNRLTDGEHAEGEWNKAIVDNSDRNLSGATSDETHLASAENLEHKEPVPENDSTNPPIRANLRRRRRGFQPQKNTQGGRSEAPAVLLVVDKGDGIVDAFWFFFYSFNLGNVVFNIRFGNHVGDWEHTTIRFHHGIPKAVFFSEHNFGSAYTYAAVEKMGKRPVIYSATGTHAMYATPGIHAYVLPWGLLHDQTDRGPLWDPALNMHTYTYDHLNDTLRSSQLTPNSPTEWFHFNGKWGDKFYPLGDTRQYRLAGQYHYVNGPLGPKFKNLGRTQICPDELVPCKVKNWLGGSSRVHRGKGPGKGEEMSAKDASRFLGKDGHTSSPDDLRVRRT